MNSKDTRILVLTLSILNSIGESDFHVLLCALEQRSKHVCIIICIIKHALVLCWLCFPFQFERGVGGVYPFKVLFL